MVTALHKIQRPLTGLAHVIFMYEHIRLLFRDVHSLAHFGGNVPVQIYLHILRQSAAAQLNADSAPLKRGNIHYFHQSVSTGVNSS